MKKLFALCTGGCFALCLSCGGNDAQTPIVSHEIKEDLSTHPDYKAGLALVAQNDCLTCHAINATTTGPAYADIAAKYAGANPEQITKLAKTIIAGGSGNWGSVPMTPHPNLSEEDAEKMVKYILLLKK